MQERFVLALVLEDLPEIARLLEVFFSYVRRIALDSADPLVMRNIGRTNANLAEGRSD